MKWLSPPMRLGAIPVAALAGLALATGSGGAQTTRGGPLAPGSYECWAFSSPRMGLNFTITGPGAYRGAEGGTGAFSYDAATGAITFTSGPLAGAMPTGFRVIYEVRRGKPTVSFVGTSGAEASFCEKV